MSNDSLVAAERARIAAGNMSPLDARLALFLFRGADAALRIAADFPPEQRDATRLVVELNREVMSDPQTAATVERIAQGTTP